MIPMDRRLLGFVAGVTLHILIFRRGEWDLSAPRMIASFLAMQLATIAFFRLQNSTDNFDIYLASWKAFDHSLCLLLGLGTSILIYRAFLHRLNHFPGPFMARLSGWYPTWLSRRLHFHEEAEKLHKRFGDFVRIGPCELSVTHPDAFALVSSAHSPCRKGPFYDILRPLRSLLTTRDKGNHAQRRKVWDRGFSTKALRDYEPRVVRYAEQLLSKIEADQGRPMNVNDWFSFYTFDVMGDLAFGTSFGMVRDGVRHYFMNTIRMYMELIGYLFHVPWMFPIFAITPGLNYEQKRFLKFIEEQVEKRKKMTPDQPDIFSWILEDYNARTAKNKTVQDEWDLLADAQLIVVAGSDTTSGALTVLFFELVQRPEQIAKLRDEVDALFESGERVSANSLSKLRHLDAVINEALRLHPPGAPSGTQRMTSPEGMRIGDVFVPGDTMIQVPFHTIFRDERNYIKPNEFIPERWTIQPELIKDASSFAPFSAGPYSCIGKQLGLLEVRYVVAQIVRRYEFRMAEGESVEAFREGTKDTFTLTVAPLNLVFTARRMDA